jgi:hypothetical protein
MLKQRDGPSGRLAVGRAPHSIAHRPAQPSRAAARAKVLLPVDTSKSVVLGYCADEVAADVDAVALDGGVDAAGASTTTVRVEVLVKPFWSVAT